MSDELRVMHVIASVATDDGGPVEVVRRLTELLPLNGILPSVVTTDRRLDGCGHGIAENVSVVVVPGRAPARYNFAPSIGRAIRSRIPETDVMHIHAVDTYTSSVAASLATAHRVPFVLQPHGAYDAFHRNQNRLAKGAYLRLFDRRNFSRAAYVIASSSREAMGVRDTLDREATVIPLGVDPWLFSLDRRQDGPRNLLFLGRLTEKKCVDFAIRAFAHSGVAHRGVRFTVAGPPDPRLAYDPRQVAESEGVTSSVDFVGSVDRDQRARLLATSDALLLPSRDESFGLAAAEAMAAGCALVTTPHVGAARDAPPNAAAIWDLDLAKWATGIEWLVANDEARRELARAGREYARMELNWEAIARRFADTYRRALDSAP